jgi:TFIIH basal transcription factor complex TTD-A subunit
MPKPKKPTLKGSAASSVSGASAANKGSATQSSAAAPSAAAARGSGSVGASGGGGGGSGGNNDDIPPSAGYLISCDVPLKQFIQHLNELKPVDKRFILQDLDATHLLVKRTAKDEILKKVEEFEDSNIFSAVERVGEDLGVS